MNKTELIASMAEKSQLSKKDAEKALNAFIESVEEALAKVTNSVGRIWLFWSKRKSWKKGKKPSDKRRNCDSATKTPIFKVGKGLKELVNK